MPDFRDTGSKGSWPKLGPRMPPTTQRRKRGYLNCANYRRRRLSLELYDHEAATLPGLAIDLGGSVDRRFRTAALAARPGSPQLTLERRDIEGTVLATTSPSR